MRICGHLILVVLLSKVISHHSLQKSSLDTRGIFVSKCTFPNSSSCRLVSECDRPVCSSCRWMCIGCLQLAMNFCVTSDEKFFEVRAAVVAHWLMRWRVWTLRGTLVGGGSCFELRMLARPSYIRIWKTLPIWHNLRVMTPEFAGALHELEAQRVERPKVFAIGALLEHGLSIRLITEGKDAELEEVARRLEELLSDWKKGVRGKTSGTAFASWQKTLSAARHFVKLFQGVVERRQDKRARLEDFPSQVGLWHNKPVNFVELGRGLRVLFGEDDVEQ